MGRAARLATITGKVTSPMKIALLFIFFASPAFAQCNAGESTFMSCQIKDNSKSVAVCYDDTTAYYRFGPTGQPPELSLQVTIADLDYRPWNGTGGGIWEEVAFVNNNYEYAVHGGVELARGDNGFEDAATQKFGAVSVARDGTIFLDLDCDDATVTFVPDLYLWNAKESLGLVWDYDVRKWVAQSD